MRIMPLLRLDRSSLYDRTLTTDLQLDGLLSDRALRVLRTPCDPPRAKNIAARQTFFACMNDRTFTERLEAFRSALFRLSKQLELCKESRIDLEALCLRLQALSAYLAVCKALEALDGTTELLSDAYAKLNDDEHRTMLAQMELDLVEADRILKAIDRSIFLLTDSITFADSAWLLKDNGNPTFSEQLITLAGKMGIEISLSSPRPLKLDAMIGDAYTELYKDEVGMLRTISARYASLDLSAPLIWLDELSFFDEIHTLVKKANERGIPACLPTVSNDKCYRATDAYDITLTVKDCPQIIPNDIDFASDAPVCFLTGANGGGKTTYLRTVGVNLLFFLAGCPIFARNAEIYPFSGLFTHFPEDEDFSGMGRLDSEKLRVDRILERADEKSFILLNETFSATDEEKGFRLALSTAETMRNRGIFGLYVTHFHEVKSKGFPLLSAVVEENGDHRRTFKIYRSDGAHSSYARDILRKYKLDKASLAERRAQT